MTPPEIVNLAFIYVLLIMAFATVISGVLYLFKRKRTKHESPTVSREKNQKEENPSHLPRKYWYEEDFSVSPLSTNPETPTEANAEKSEFEKALHDTIQVKNVLNQHSGEQYSIKVTKTDGRTTGALKHKGQYYLLEIQPKETKPTESTEETLIDEEHTIPGEQKVEQKLEAD